MRVGVLVGAVAGEGARQYNGAIVTFSTVSRREKPMIHRDALVAACDRELAVERFRDYTINGLQVEGRDGVRRVLSEVTASQALLDEAVAWEADLVLVHHGYFWKNEPVAITGMKRRRIQALLAHEINQIGRASCRERV